MDDMIFSFKVETPPAWIPIGRTAENDWRTIEIDCSYWFNMDATGNVVLMYRPSCGMAAYPLLIERDGDNIVWHPKSGELVEGVGQMQAFFYVGESKIGSSEMVSCEVDGSLLGGDPGTDPGAVAPPWAIDIIEQIAVLSGHYPKIIDGNLYIWDSALNEWVEFEASGGGSSDAVLYTPQTLNDSQKAQARSNIDAAKLFVVGIASESDPLTANKTFAETYAATQNGMLVRADLWNMDGDLWLDCIDAEPTRIVFGGGAFGAQMTLVFGSDESLTRTTRQIPTDTVLYTEQSLTPEQQEQARKNIGAGTYTKPSGGIPKSDLAADVQTSLGKADTALQEHQSLAGYATETYVQQQIAAIPDELPAVAAADNGKFLRVVSGAWAAASVPFQTPRVAMTASDTTPTLDPNKLYVFPEMASLAPSLATPTDATIVNEYHFIFTSGATAATLTLPASVLQPDGFTVEENMHYEISILEGAMTAQGWAVTA